ncbi:hypothetical protein SmJEL517_g00719 [Synchytrium microbalum]|uniref:Uncharacterized protein n=1 Tax=Synchytrium microbalum TaxID=1806994 RepID=A0A507C7X2_9FUNG|nr:uncharacterized protein SmJEL517_g00719 [Synchytrium microbalum]TPX37680.1 hypothetical protein SmJEL517_g00719 [Synchytrium microbalum]
MFFDLDIPAPSAGKSEGQPSQAVFLNTAETCKRLGYHGVAYSTTLPLKTALTKPCDIKLPNLSSDDTNSLANLSSHTKPVTNTTFHQLTRLTVVAEESAMNVQLTANNQNLLTYDIVAVIPTSEKMLQQACQSYDVDIICLEMSTRISHYLRPSTLNIAIQRGIYFEISYAAAIRDTTARRNLLGNAANLVRATRGKNILVSSSAAAAMELRGPYDVMNLCNLFGLDHAAGKRAISAHCRAVIFHAATRRLTYRGVAAMEPLSALAKSDAWMVGGKDNFMDVSDAPQRGEDGDDDDEDDTMES